MVRPLRSGAQAPNVSQYHICQILPYKSGRPAIYLSRAGFSELTIHRHGSAN
jgi:hypothetical protein